MPNPEARTAQRWNAYLTLVTVAIGIIASLTAFGFKLHLAHHGRITALETDVKWLNRLYDPPKIAAVDTTYGPEIP